MAIIQSLLERQKKLNIWLEKPLAVPLVLLIFAIACYGLLINRLGYFWDDFPLAYIKNTYGSVGLERYFATNRPFWGVLYQVTFSLFNHPWQWQINALVWRWVSAVILWLIIREVWSNHKPIALWTGLLFLVYPGFTQQHISVIYSNLFLIMDCFLLSLYLNIKVIRKPESKGSLWKVVPYHGLALLLSLINLLTLEYFFALELLRPCLTWLAIEEKYPDRKARLKSTFVNWLPYLSLWVGVTIWRIFFFSFQTHNYQLRFLQSAKESFIPAILNLLKAIGSSIWVVLVSAWGIIFKLPDLQQLGIRTTIATLSLILVSFGLLVLLLVHQNQESDWREGYLSVLSTGILACLLGGVPWWLTELLPALRFPNDRFTLPFILGVSLVIAGILGLLPIRAWIKLSIVSLLVAFAVGSHFQVANQFRRDWETQRRFFWQLAWRIPELESGTTLMVNDLPVSYYSDNSLTAPLNWFWAPMNATKDMSYLLLYPSQRLGKSLTSLAPGTAISVNYLAATFNGNTSQTVSIYYQPPACLRVLERTLDSDNRMIPSEMQAAATLSSTEWIKPVNSADGQILPKDLYAPEPAHNWCFYFENADLARQKMNWGEVATLGEQAYQLNDYPNDPAEHFVFIEGYAHTGKWETAVELTRQSLKVTPLMEPLICRLWQRIDSSTGDSQEKDTAINQIYSQINCET